MWCISHLCHSTCVKLTQEYFVVCMVEQRNKCKTRTTKRPAGPAWFCRNLSSLGCSRERTAYQRKSVLHDSTILKILPSYAYQEHIQKQSKTSLSCYFQKHTTGCLSVGARVFIFWCIDMIYDSIFYCGLCRFVSSGRIRLDIRWPIFHAEPSHPSPQFHQAITRRRQGATGILDKLQTLLVAILHAACFVSRGEKKTGCGLRLVDSSWSMSLWVEISIHLVHVHRESMWHGIWGLQILTLACSCHKSFQLWRGSPPDPDPPENVSSWGMSLRHL